MIDYYLRSNDEESMRSAICGSPKDSLLIVDHIGLISKELDDGSIVELGGYHANVRSEYAIEWPDSIEVMSPDKPFRVFLS